MTYGKGSETKQMLNKVNRLRITTKAIKDAIKYKRKPEGTPPLPDQAAATIEGQGDESIHGPPRASSGRRKSEENETFCVW